MDNTARKIFLACAIGAVTGLLIALNLPFVVWWLGAIVGGVSSGFIYALPGIRREAPTAARIAWNKLSYAPGAIIAFGEKPIVYKWKVVGFLMLILSCFLFFTAIIIMAMAAKKEEIGVIILILLMSSVFYIFFAEVYLFSSTSDWYNQGLTEAQRIRKLQKAALVASPIGPLVFVVPAIIRMPRFFLVAGKESVYFFINSVYFLANFVKTLFVLVHSNELVLCVVDGALGVAISYPVFVVMWNMQTGPVLLLGGLVGGMIGTLNYEIVSKRILRLVPRKG